MSSSKEVEMTEQDETSPSNPQQPTSTPKATPKADLITLAFGCDLDESNNNPNSFATSNTISTTRYNLWSFLPKSLFEQFRRIANIYFLIQVRAWCCVLIICVLWEFVWSKEMFNHVKKSSKKKEEANCTQPGQRRRKTKNKTNTSPPAQPCLFPIPRSRLTFFFLVVSLLPFFSGVVLMRQITIPPTHHHHHHHHHHHRQATLMVLGEQFPDDVFQTPYGSYTVTSSLAVVVGFTMVKEAVEDRKRYRKDQQTNARTTYILDASGNFEKREWKDVRVGNIVKVFDRGEMPADLVLLSSVNKDGGCYVETSNIDGETNLKIREAETTLAQHVRTGAGVDPIKLAELRGELKCEAPNKNIHSFVGRIDVSEDSESSKPIAVGSKQFLLRGSQLRNTPWIWGIVVYTGPQTKVMKNSRDAPSKLSILEQTMNQCIMLVLATQMVVCLAGAVAGKWTVDVF